MTQQRNSALDGLRGIAILLVLLHHFAKLPGGWAGVDIFFVLSGFLITTILRGDRSEKNFWKIYYARRATRILPPFLLLLFATIVTVPLAWRSLWPYFAFFGENIATYRFGDEIGPLAVLWSLAIEEHFYFIWPAAVRWLSDRALLMICAGVLGVEPLLRLIAYGLGMRGWAAFYELTPFRLDGLAAGALLSIVLSMESFRDFMARWMNMLLLVVLSLCVLFFGGLQMTRPGNPLFFAGAGYSILAVTGGLLLSLMVLRPQGLLGRAFSWRPLIFLGQISYGFYLYHPLIIVWCNRILLRFHIVHMRSLASFPVSLLIAWVSFRFLESPILAHGRRLVQEQKRDNRAVDSLVEAPSASVR